MRCSASSALFRARPGVLGVVLAFSLAACGGTSSSGSPQTTSAAGVPAPTNEGLALSGMPLASIVAGQRYAFSPAASGGSGTLTFTIVNMPGWASFDSGTGQLNGTPALADVGTYANVQISVADGQASAALPAFSITVLAPLTISGSPVTEISAGASYSFVPTASAASGTALTFSVQNRPAWASFNAANGALTGTPGAANVGAYPRIVISVSDGTQSVALAPFAIAVVKGVTVKGVTISGNPPTSVNAGSPYSFRPTVSGPGGATLSFSIQNQPAWASFNAANGALTGNPTAANVGTYSNIMISVTNGSSDASLPAFSVSVDQVSNGTASLTWTPVTKNTNGSVLGNLAGYRVRYGTSANGMNTVVTLANPSLTNYLVTNLSSGTWYFGITAYTKNGRESSLSNVGRKTIP